MFRTICIVCAIIFSGAGTSGQEITWGTLNKSLNDKYSPEILRTDSDFIYTLSYDYLNYYIEKFDIEKMMPVYSKKVHVPVLGELQTELELISLINDKFVVFYSFYNVKENFAELHAYTVDAATGEGRSHAVKLMKLPVENSRRAGEFGAITSKDGKRILVNHSCYLRNQRMHQENYVLFNDSLKILLDRNEKIEKAELNYRTFSYRINNDGSVYFIKASDEGLFVVSYDALNDYEKWEEKIDLSEHHPNTVLKSAYLGFNDNQDLIITGLYGLEDSYQGLYYMQIDRYSKEMTINRFNELENSEKESLNYIRPGDRDDIVYGNIMTLNKKDGGMYIFCEQFDRKILYGQYSATCHSWYYDVALFDVSAEGEILKLFRIPKAQYDRSTISAFYSAKRMVKKCEYLSILPWMDDTNVYLAYNDHTVNLPYADPKASYKKLMVRDLDNSSPVLITINRESGAIIKNTFRDMKSDEIIFKPQISYSVPNTGRLFIFAQKGLNYRFGTIVFE